MGLSIGRNPGWGRLELLSNLCLYVASRIEILCGFTVRWPATTGALLISKGCRGRALPDAEALAGASGILHRYDPFTGRVFAFEEFGHDADFNKAYVQHYASVNPYPAESFHRLKTGKVDYAGTLLPVSQVVGTEFYNDWMKPQGISPNHLGVVLSRSGGAMSLLCVAPHARVFDKDPKQFGGRLQMLVPHMARALELNRGSGQRSSDQ